MNDRRIDEGSRILATMHWGAIAAGAFVALALQSLLLVLGLALGASLGDRTIGGGFAWWAVAVQLAALAAGGVIAAGASTATTQLAGVVVGAMVWAVATVVTGLFGGLALGGLQVVQFGPSGAWAAFFGILLGLGAAVLGGLFGTHERRGDELDRPRAPNPPPASAPPVF